MLELFAKLEEKLKRKENCILNMVIASSGSVPREAGAAMLVGAKGRFWGTIGGGVIEYKATLRSQELLQLQQTKQEHFDMSVSSNAMCGGAYDVLLYYLDFSKKEICEAWEMVLEQARESSAFQLLLPLEGGVPVIKKETQPLATVVQQEGQSYYAQSFNMDGKVYIFGGGHVAQELVPVLTHLDFSCTVLDDREEFANKDVFPEAAITMIVDYHNLGGLIQVQAEDYIVIMTRGHEYDTEVERFALQTKARYIGLMGSKTKKALTRTKLLAEGFEEQALDRVIIPIGLDIKSETPAEIAISIAAQLILERAQKSNGLNKYRV